MHGWQDRVRREMQKGQESTPNNFASGSKENEEKKPKKRGRPKKGEVGPEQEVKRLDKQIKMTQEERLANLPKACHLMFGILALTADTLFANLAWQHQLFI